MEWNGISMNSHQLITRSFTTVLLAGFLSSIGLVIAQAQSPGLMNKAGNWNEFSTQGYTLYTSNNGLGSLMEISCDVATGNNNPPAVGMLFNGSSINEKTSVEFGVDGQKLIFASGLDNIGRDKFRQLWTLLRLGKELRVELHFFQAIDRIDNRIRL